METQKNLELNVTPRKKRRFSWVLFIAIVVFVISLGLDIGGWWFVKRVTEKEAKAKFDDQVTQIEFLIRNHIDAYLDILYDLQGFFGWKGVVGWDEWQAQIKRQKRKESYPSGIGRLDFVARVKHADQDAFVQSVRSDATFIPAGFRNFSIHPYVPIDPSNEPEEYFVSTYVDPYEGNENALGLEHGSDPNRLSALEAARDLDRPQATRRTVLVADPEKQPAYLIFAPVYHEGVPISTMSERREALKGFVAGVFKMRDMFSAVSERKKSFREIEFRIFEGDTLNQYLTEEDLIYESTPSAESGGTPEAHPRFAALSSFNVAGRIWTVYFYTTSQFLFSSYYELLPRVVLSGGLLFSILLFSFLCSLANLQSQAVRIAENMTQQFRESEERFRSVVQSANDAIITADSDGNIIAWNKGAEKIFGYSEKEMLAKPLTTIMPERFHKAHLEGIKRISTGGETRVIGKTVELVGLRKDGSEFPIELSLSTWKTGGSAFFSGILHDVTDRKHAEEEVKKAHFQLIEAEKSATVAQLAVGAAHEVKNPLAILLQGVDYLTHHVDKEKNSNIPSVLKDMEDAVTRADYTIKGLLDLARPHKLTMASEDLNSIIENSLLLVKYHLNQHHAQVIKNFGPKLPLISADKSKIVQAFVNLLANAVEAMPEGGAVTIKTYAKKLAEAGGQVGRRKEDIFSVGQPVVITEIEDTGTGIPPEVLPKIFDPFFTTKRSRGGTGLGLSVVKNIVEIHRGTIFIENKKEGRGARAVVVFPAKSVTSKK